MTILDTVKNNMLIHDENIIKTAIINNQPIEKKLNVIIVVSNPCNYKRRIQLAKEFINRLMIYNNNDVELYIVEMVYGNQEFKLTQNNNSKHLQLRTITPLWHKENMINLGVKKLLPKNWKAFAWIDADIEFDSPTWATDTLKILNGARDVIQLFSHAIDMDNNKNTTSIFNSFGHQYITKKEYNKSGIDFWHPGFAWACTRTAYNKMKGLYDLSILGSGDHHMALSFISNINTVLHQNPHPNYMKSLSNFCNNAIGLRIGYTPGVIRHHFHGTKKNRKYSDRYKILEKYQYDPFNHVKYNKEGIIIPTNKFPEGLKEEILQYFIERNEDE